VLSPWDGPVLEGHCCHQYFGGDLQGIIDKLDYLESLGTTVVYMNPIFLAGSAHGYDTYDYFEVAPNFGDSTVLRTLMDAAHARGIRLIWDFVPNHVGIGHWAFQDAVQNGEGSAYWDWFDFYVPADSIRVGNGNDYEAWWGFGSLPELQTGNPEVMDHLMSVAEGWTRFGLDGIRVDVPQEIENRYQFFTTFRQTAKAVDPQVYLVGEIWEQAPGWLLGDQFDALMNYAIGQGVVARFARGEIAGVTAARSMASLYAAYPEASTAMLFNLIASHDTDRVLTMMGGGELGDTPSDLALERQRLAAAFLFALPGMPVTFQGDECAFLGGSAGLHTARYPVQWDACDAAMNAYYTMLAGLKTTLAGLASPAIREYLAGTRLLAFFRGEPGPGEVLAVFNNGSAAATLELPAGSWTDAVTGGAESGSVSVDGRGWRYLVRD
jgi:glycosidase